MQWTNEQRRAFSLKQKEILVSAAAGSGKTTVMVERVLALITDAAHPVDVDRLLIVTFTNAAASSMRQKIRNAIDQKRAEDPENIHLQRQALLVDHAQISTIDSFCAFIVKNYFYLLDGVSADYRIGEKSELQMMEDEVLQEVLEEAYGQADEAFFHLVDSLAAGKSDLPLENYIRKLYQYAQSHEDPEAWLAGCTKLYDAFSAEPARYTESALRLFQGEMKAAATFLENALDLCRAPDGPYIYEELLLQEQAQFAKMAEAKTIPEITAALSMCTFASLSRKKDDAIAPEKRQQAQTFRNAAKKSVSKLQEIFVSADPDRRMAEITACGDRVRELVRITTAFGRRLLEQKKEKNIFNYSDIAHFALAVLKMPHSPAKMQLQNLYAEIFIDEYQDSNLLQEELLYHIAKEISGVRRVFMVGDVKQSIYGFRNACPDLFIQKLRTFQETEGNRIKLFLSENFRSRKQVVDAVNVVFSELMQENICGVAYDQTQRLKYAASYQPEVSEALGPELLHYENTDKEIEHTDAEICMIAKRIRELTDPKSPLLIQDPETGARRPAAFKDIVILARNWNVVESVRRTLSDIYQIPVAAAARTSFFNTFEIITVVNYLRILNNPQQDIPMASVLLSPTVDFSAEELARIRIRCGKKSLYTAISEYRIQENDALCSKIDAFLSVYERLRAKTRLESADQILSDLYEATGIEACVSAMPAGQNRRENLKKLCAKARQFVQTGYRSLFDFLCYIEKQIEYEISEEEWKISGDGANAVRVMTMHKSKGLEFPIVFLAGLEKQFNYENSTAPVIMHRELGIGVNYVDFEKRFRKKTMVRQIIEDRIRRESCGEEIRILYVAMTRAKEKLILCCSHSEKQALAGEGGGLSENDVLKAQSFWEWLRKIIPAHPECFEIREFTTGALLDTAAGRQEKAAAVLSEETGISVDAEALLAQLQFTYEPRSLQHFEKWSVSKLKKEYQLRQQEEADFEDGRELIRPEPEYPTLPAFLKEKEGIPAAERGQLYHYILECWDFTRPSDTGAVQKMIAALQEQGSFSEAQANCVHAEKIARFLNSSLGKRMQAASLRRQLMREQPFTILFDGAEAGITAHKEELLLQGVIDVCFEEDGALVLLDYKTDYLPDKNLQVLADRYRAQLLCYRCALEKLTGKPVKEMWIYSLYADQAIQLAT